MFWSWSCLNQPVIYAYDGGLKNIHFESVHCDAMSYLGTDLGMYQSIMAYSCQLERGELKFAKIFLGENIFLIDS